ncbi:hypothetical protein F53441_13269 [Fusarium austroafricanum]|uniref:CFEM domain-containing protein n=1 Tax=Fusarium austroafricanum TaxID=2364996 RepID=A0A8H4NRY3_9HYPO|nr:hypothetical protein F53441_13269 [Fusarium austroafricanum]
MKSTFLAIFGLAATAVAQSSNDLPQCGQTCAGNMVSAEKSKELGCGSGDISCLCTNQDFIYGLRDCSAAICSGEQAAQVLNYGLELCRRAGVKITTGASGEVSATATGSGAVRTVLSTLTSGDSTITSALSTISGTATGSDAGKDVSVSTYTSVLTNSEGDEFTTTGKAILGGARVTTFTSGGSTIVSTIASETSEAESAEVTTLTSDGTEIVRTLVTETASTDSAKSAEVTTFTTDGTQVVRTLTTVTSGSESGSVSETVTDASTATEGATDATGTEASATTTGSGNAAAAQMTGAPAGVIAAAGIAMLLL